MDSVCPGLTRKIINSFYGFPSSYYEEKFPNVGSREIAQKVIDAIREAGMKAEGVKRGLDHGVWASFKCGTSSRDNPPLVTFKCTFLPLKIGC